MIAAKRSEDVFNAYLKRQELVSGGTISPQWTADGLGLWFVAGARENRTILRTDLSTGTTVPMFDVNAVRAALSAATGYEPPYRGVPFETFDTMPDGRVAFTYEGAKWRLDPSTSRVERIEGLDSFSGALGWQSEDKPTASLWKRYDYLSISMEVPEQLSPNGEWFASVRDNNIWLRPARARGGGEQQLTSEGTPDRFWDFEALRFQLLSGRRVTFRAVNPWSPDSLTSAATAAADAMPNDSASANVITFMRFFDVASASIATP